MHFIKSNDGEEQYEEATANKGALEDISWLSEEADDTSNHDLAKYLYELKLATTKTTRPWIRLTPKNSVS